MLLYTAFVNKEACFLMQSDQPVGLLLLRVRR